MVQIAGDGEKPRLAPAGDLLAHSRRGDVPPQKYVDHISQVCESAVRNASRAAEFHTADRSGFVEAVRAAAIYHDLGKLDEANQGVLRRDARDALPIPHEDAGVAALDELRRSESMVLVAAHHAGLFSREEQLATQGRPFRDLRRRMPSGEAVADHVDRNLQTYAALHRAAACVALDKVEPAPLHNCGFTRRVALSCLVDADHGDTARHYGGERQVSCPSLSWEKRALGLQRYVDALPPGDSPRERDRNALRRRVFEACLDAPVLPAIRSCDAPVGSGKTTAVMAHLLRVAAERKLRHIFVVLPYTNIIIQAADVYRNALVLEGEQPEEVVAEHHHRADFGSIELRQLATLWKAPITVTTAVQFFETLGSHHPSRLRKLHELPGSAVFIDEMHAAMPPHLWPQVWRWMETWTRDWGGHVVLGSGSLPRFWDLAEYRGVIRGNSGESMLDVPDLLSKELRNELQAAEKRRIRFLRQPAGADALDCSGLIGLIQARPGPRLVIVNTVQTAAVLADRMRKQGHDVLHLSTALAPAHRSLVVQRIKWRLREKIVGWTLVATSCVESGMDLSFRTGFRERASTASLIQTAGRVNRGHEHEDDAEVWDLLLRDDLFRGNPTMEVARRVLDEFTEVDLNSQKTPVLATDAMRREWTCGADQKARKLVAAEEAMEYPEVGTLCRVIDADTRTVVIDPGLAEAIRKGRRVSGIELLNYSVQMWATRIDKLRLGELPGGGELYAWDDAYGPEFLGYMAGVLRNEEFVRSGGCVI